ncbi:hypothetical protein V8C44DRAFT_303478 [Trichoderma aethiopicum]
MKGRYAYRQVPMFDSCDCLERQAECRSAHAGRPRNPEMCGLARLSDKLIGRLSPWADGRVPQGWGGGNKNGSAENGGRVKGSSWCLVLVAGTCLALAVGWREAEVGGESSPGSLNLYGCMIFVTISIRRCNLQPD